MTSNASSWSRLQERLRAILEPEEYADIGALHPAATDGGELAKLQYPEQARLRRQRHVADLVEE